LIGAGENETADWSAKLVKLKAERIETVSSAIKTDNLVDFIP
jgi:hypothetical protein